MKETTPSAMPPCFDRGFTLIVDDSGHRKSGNFTSGVGRHYIGEIGKTDNGIVVVTTHLYDGKKAYR
jgi:SRSO17 transposase